MLNKMLMFKNYIKIIAVLGLIVMANCARRGTITGGLKDTLAPQLTNSLPKNYTLNFKGNAIKLNFNEYVKLKDVNKQLIVSPPMKFPLDISPYLASQYLNIKIKDTLKPNTTYSFNFGNSIQDNNENNPIKQFKFVFSTGTYIDSLKLSVKVKDALERNVTNFVSFFLYEATEKYTDSVIYKQMPRYVTNSLDSLKIVEFENLREGKYRLIALKDVNNNNKFDPKTDKIGFVNDFISIPNQTQYELKLFKELLPFKAISATQASGNKIIVGYEGATTALKTELKMGTKTQPFVVTKVPKKDSLNIWFKAQKNDSVTLQFSKDKYLKKFDLKIKNQKKDTLQFSPEKSDVILLRDNYIINTSRPIAKIDTSKMLLLNKDSVAQKFTTDYDAFNQQLIVKFEKEPLQKYKLKMFPSALLDFYDTKNDSLTFKFSTKNTSDYGNLRVTLENVKRFPVIVEITSEKGEVIASETADTNTTINFDLVEPAKFLLRLIYDDNKNKIWDTGNFLEQRQPEEVIYFPKLIDVRANWDVEQPFDLRE